MAVTDCATAYTRDFILSALPAHAKRIPKSAAATAPCSIGSTAGCRDRHGRGWSGGARGRRCAPRNGLAFPAAISMPFVYVVASPRPHLVIWSAALGALRGTDDHRRGFHGEDASADELCRKSGWPDRAGLPGTDRPPRPDAFGRVSRTPTTTASILPRDRRRPWAAMLRT